MWLLGNENEASPPDIKSEYPIHASQFEGPGFNSQHLHQSQDVSNSYWLFLAKHPALKVKVTSLSDEILKLK